MWILSRYLRHALCHGLRCRHLIGTWHLWAAPGCASIPLGCVIMGATVATSALLPLVGRNWTCLMTPLMTDGQMCGTMAKWTSGVGTLSFAPQTLRGGSSVPSHMKGVTPKLWFLIGHGAWPSTAAYCHMSLCLCMCHLTTIGLGSARHGTMA